MLVSNLNSCNITLVWFCIIVKPDDPYRVFFVVGKRDFFQAVRIEQLPDGFDYVLSQFFNPVAETHGRVSDLAFANPFPERKDLHVGVTAEIPVCHLVIIAGSVDIASQYQTAVFLYHSFRLVAVFRHDLVGTLEGVPYSYFVLCHNSYDLIVVK